LVNDRADIALAAHADGVHLSTLSVDAATIRRAFGDRLLIGVSTHNLQEARNARDDAADFAVFGPVFDTPSKYRFGTPVGLEALAGVAGEMAPFPIIALGGVTQDNAAAALGAGASGIAAIRLFSEPAKLESTVAAIRKRASAP
jgi:thiamine-phosphate pyrophosphorylase